MYFESVITIKISLWGPAFSVGVWFQSNYFCKELNIKIDLCLVFKNKHWHQLLGWKCMWLCCRINFENFLKKILTFVSLSCDMSYSFCANFKIHLMKFPSCCMCYIWSDITFLPSPNKVFIQIIKSLVFYFSLQLDRWSLMCIEKYWRYHGIKLSWTICTLTREHKKPDHFA